MSEYNFFDNSHLIVQTNPTITFSNGMVLWLAEKGETVELTQMDWDLLQAADQYIKRIGLVRYGLNGKKICVAANPVPKEEDNSIFGSILRFLFGWMMK